MKYKKLLFLVILASSQCLTLEVAPDDPNEVSIHLVSLYNQQSHPSDKPDWWQQDWLLRRRRLELINGALEASPPDLFIGTEAMRGNLVSSSDSDKKILEAGALKGFSSVEQLVRSEVGSHEQTEFVASLPPRHIKQVGFWPLPEGHYIAATLIQRDGRADLGLLTVDFPQTASRSFHRTVGMALRMLIRRGVCESRLVVAGHIPNQVARHPVWKSFELADTSGLTCVAYPSSCMTESKSNSLRQRLWPDREDSRSLRIFVHSSTRVRLSQRTLDKGIKDSFFQSKYQLTSLFPSHRYGWMIKASMKSCPAIKPPPTGNSERGPLK